MDKQKLLSLYASEGYTLAEVEPRSIVVSTPSSDLEREILEQRLEQHLQEYKMAQRDTYPQDIERTGFTGLITDLQNTLSDDPKTWILPPLAKVPHKEKYVLLDPFMMHWVFAYSLNHRSIPSILFAGDQPHKIYNVTKGCWEKYPHSLDDTFHDPTKTFDGKKHVEYCIKQYVQDNILFNFEKLD